MTRQKRPLSRRPLNLLEGLEQRVLFHDGLSLHVAFGLSPVGEPYNLDSGKVYSAQDDGVLYGWTNDNTANVHVRHGVAAPDQLHRGYAVLPAANQNVWQIQLPDADYTVHVVTGDANATSARYRVAVEGVLTVDGKATASEPWVEGTQTVSVTDGELTVSSAAGTSNNKIDYIDITQFDDPKNISVAADPSVPSSGPHSGAFIFSRSGSVTDAASYDYIIGGSAKQGRDYTPLSGTVTFPAGAAQTTVDVSANIDQISSATQTVMVTLVPGAEFFLGTPSATTTIAGLPKISSTTTTTSKSFSTTRINFQTSSSAVPDYYKADTGATYALRANGLTYGWSASETADARDHTEDAGPDSRYLTLAQMQKNGENLSWSIAVPNGTYTVRVVAGDPDYTNSVFKLNVNGTLTVNGTPTSSNHWVEGTKTITVTNGKITISNGTGSNNDKIDFVEIAPGSNPLPVVSVAASGSPAEGGGTGKFTLTRTGSTASALTVNYTMSGTASNGTDYSPLSGAVTIAAGSATAAITLKPIDDSAVEGNESAVFTISTSSSYSNGQVETASRTIADNDVNTTSLGKLKWTQVASSPVGRSEAETGTVDGKVYVFGGFSDSSFSQGLRSDVYDPSSNKWTQIANMPRAITHAGTTVDGDTIWLVGGYAQDPGGSAGGKKTFGITDVWEYNTDTNSWSKGPALPAARAAGGLVKDGDSLYFFGGENAARAADVTTLYTLDLDNQSAGWKTLASMPAARNHVGAVVIDGLIYAVGGQTGFDNSSDFHNSLYSYDPATNKWTTLANLPESISHIANSTIVYKDQIITLGGQGPGLVELNDVNAYNPSTNKWTALQPLPGDRLSGAGASLGNEIFFTSGYSGVFDSQSWIGTFS